MPTTHISGFSLLGNQPEHCTERSSSATAVMAVVTFMRLAHLSLACNPIRYERYRTDISCGVDAVPEKLIRSQVKLSGNFCIGGGNSRYPACDRYILQPEKRPPQWLRWSGFDRIRDGHIITKYGHGRALKRLTLTEAGTRYRCGGRKGTQRMFDIARKAGENDRCLSAVGRRLGTDG